MSLLIVGFVATAAFASERQRSRDDDSAAVAGRGTVVEHASFKLVDGADVSAFIIDAQDLTTAT